MIKRILVGLVLLIPLAAYASLPKTWGAEVLRYSDLNANFSHVEAALRGGTHTLITNSDLSPSALIAHSKLATPALVPKAFAYVDTTTCPNSGSASCTLSNSSGFTNCRATSTTGRYWCALSTAPPSGLNAVIVTPKLTGTVDVTCGAISDSSADPHVVIHCWDISGHALADQPSGFSVMVMY